VVYSLSIQEAEYSFSGFIPTNKQTKKKALDAWRQNTPKKKSEIINIIERKKK